MKLVQIAGYLGSGKTSLIIALMRHVAAHGAKVAVLVNDVGEVPVDGKVMQEYGLTVKDIGGGCICCQVAGNMIKTLETLARTQQPDIVIVEPTGMAVPSSVRSTAQLSANKTGLTAGPTIVLLDATRMEKLLGYETLRRLVSTQLKDADVIALSKADAVSDEVLAKAEGAVGEINPGARRQRLSVRTGEGVAELAAIVLGKEVSVS